MSDTEDDFLRVFTPEPPEEEPPASSVTLMVGLKEEEKPSEFKEESVTSSSLPPKKKRKNRKKEKKEEGPSKKKRKTVPSAKRKKAVKKADTEEENKIAANPSKVGKTIAMLIGKAIDFILPGPGDEIYRDLEDAEELHIQIGEYIREKFLLTREIALGLGIGSRLTTGVVEKIKNRKRLKEMDRLRINVSEKQNINN